MSEEKTRAERLREIPLPVPLEIMILFPPAIEVLVECYRSMLSEDDARLLIQSMGGTEGKYPDLHKQCDEMGKAQTGAEDFFKKLDEALMELQTPIYVDFVGTLKTIQRLAVGIKNEATGEDGVGIFRDADAITSYVRDLLNMLETRHDFREPKKTN